MLVVHGQTPSSGGATISTTAATSTIGTNTRSNRAVSCSVWAFFAWASATSWMMRSSVRSPAAFVVSTCRAPSPLTVPANT